MLVCHIKVDDLFHAQEFVKEWANDNGMNPEESEGGEDELVRQLPKSQSPPLKE